MTKLLPGDVAKLLSSYSMPFYAQRADGSQLQATGADIVAYVSDLEFKLVLLAAAVASKQE
jgi:hypothetical protein